MTSAACRVDVDELVARPHERDAFRSAPRTRCRRSRAARRERAVGRIRARHVGAVALHLRAEIGQQEAVAHDRVVVRLVVERRRVPAGGDDRRKRPAAGPEVPERELDGGLHLVLVRRGHDPRHRRLLGLDRDVDGALDQGQLRRALGFAHRQQERRRIAEPDLRISLPQLVGELLLARRRARARSDRRAAARLPRARRAPRRDTPASPEAHTRRRTHGRADKLPPWNSASMNAANRRGDSDVAHAGHGGHFVPGRGSSPSIARSEGRGRWRDRSSCRSRSPGSITSVVSGTFMPVRYSRLSSCLNGQSTSPVRRAGSNENAMKTRVRPDRLRERRPPRLILGCGDGCGVWRLGRRGRHYGRPRNQRRDDGEQDSQGIPPPQGCDHEFEEVAVRVADVHARALGLAPALARHRALDDGDFGAVEPGLEGGGRAIPHETEITAGRLRRGRTQRERRVLPAGGTVES